MSRGSAGRDLASSNVERQSELVDESGRAGRGAAGASGSEARAAGGVSGASTLDREEPRTVVRDGADDARATNTNTTDDASIGASASGTIASRNGRTNGKSFRGFAAMDQSKQREIASKGGRAAHEKGTAHQWTSDEARAAGRKGGERVSQNRQHMSTIGRRGGEARGQRARKTGSEI